MGIYLTITGKDFDAISFIKQKSNPTRFGLMQEHKESIIRTFTISISSNLTLII